MSNFVQRHILLYCMFIQKSPDFLSPVSRIAYFAGSHHGGLFSEPLWISLVLAVHLHLLGPQRHAAVAVEVQPVVSTYISPLLLQLSILRLQEL